VVGAGADGWGHGLAALEGGDDGVLAGVLAGERSIAPAARSQKGLGSRLILLQGGPDVRRSDK
jgi:hypothetical protein